VNDYSRASTRTLRLAVLFSIALVAMVIAACGGNSTPTPTQTGSTMGGMPMESDGMAMDGSGDDAHSEGSVDLNAPVLEVNAFDLRFEPNSLNVTAGESFTVRLVNEGALEHDFTIEGFEEAGAAHAMAGGEAMNTFHLQMHGDYTAYCSIPGHRAAGMEVKVVATVG